MEHRIDLLTALHVDLTVKISFAFGSAAAVDAAHQFGVSREVVQRVLIEGGLRRGATPALELSSGDRPHSRLTDAANQ